MLRTTTVAPALKALLEKFIDYAGMYPPAGLSLDQTLSNYAEYQQGEYAWMLRWLVVGSADLSRVPRSLDGALTVLSETEEVRAASVESKSVVQAKRPVYCEVAPSSMKQLDAVKQSGCYAKIRMGGVKPEAIPSTSEVAAFISSCAERRLPFKATAGLHHPIRSMQPLTYRDDAPHAVMHGFINVLMASAFAWDGEPDVESIIEETDASAFSFDERAHWRDKSLSENQIRESRINFIHSVGSCSFDEPVRDLQKLGLL